MSAAGLSKILREQETALMEAWLGEQKRGISQKDRLSDTELREQSREFVQLLPVALTVGDPKRVEGPAFEELRRLLTRISTSRAQQGFSPSETATFVFSFKQPLFAAIRKSCGADAETQVSEMWDATVLLDQLGLYTMEAYRKTREEVIARQQQEMMELSTPVVKLWDGILALPIIGTLDSARTQMIMESLLERIVTTGSEIAIIDITGVPTVDTLTAQHLLKTVTAARLMGAECIISGIRPQIAQTIVHLGVELGDVITKATLADAFRIALQKSSLQIAKIRVSPEKR